MKCDHCGCSLADNEGALVTRQLPGSAEKVQGKLCSRCASETARRVSFALTIAVLMLLFAALVGGIGYLIT